MRRRLLFAALALAGFLAQPGFAAVVPAPGPPTFDARAAWAEFAALLRTDYGYFQRPGVDGEAVLAAFRTRAEATPDAEEFVDVLQQTAANFADPHFVVGPFDGHDYCIIPTGSDLNAKYSKGIALVVQAREGGAAAARQIGPGTRIVAIDGVSVDTAIERVAGRPVAALSPVQADHALDIALAGVWKQPRHFAVAGPGGAIQVDLAATAGQAKRVEALPPLTVEHRGRVAIVRFNNSLGRNETIAAFRDALSALPAAATLVLDLRDTPSGGNTTVARGILGHFVDRPRPYQMHVVPSEARRYGVPRQYVEYVLPIAPHFAGRIVVVGGHWTGSMGEGLMVGFDAIGVPTAGSRLGGLLGAVTNEVLPLSGAKVDLGEEQLFHVDGRPREDFLPRLFRADAEAHGDADPLLDVAIRAARPAR